MDSDWSYEEEYTAVNPRTGAMMKDPFPRALPEGFTLIKDLAPEQRGLWRALWQLNERLTALEEWRSA